MNSEHMTIEIHEDELVVRFYTPSSSRFDYLRRIIRVWCPQAKGDSGRHCQVIPRTPENLKALQAFGDVFFPGHVHIIIVWMDAA